MKVNSAFLNKSLVVGIIFLFVVVGVQPAFAIVEYNDDLPDLIIEDFYLTSRIPQWGDYELWASIKNIGDFQTVGVFHFRVIIYRLIFRKIPFPVRYCEAIYNFYNNTIIPGETQKFILSSGDEIPRLRGYYRIHVAINLNKNVEESNYDNNERYENRLKDRIYWW